MGINDLETYGAMMEALELVTSIVSRYADTERGLQGSSTLKSQLEKALLKLYELVLTFFARARHYYGQNTGSKHSSANCGHYSDSYAARIAKSVLQTGISITGYVERITKEENDVYKLVVLVEMEGLILSDMDCTFQN